MTLFDEEYYLAINKARWEPAQKIMSQLDLSKLQSCLDVGCGPGWFTERLALFHDWEVRGVDGRSDLVELARTRVPVANFQIADFESEVDMARVKPANLVFCFGLLYHLENPFKALRTLNTLTSQVLMLETQIIPREEASFWLVEEGRNETQGLTHMAVIPTRRSLIKMMYASGFEQVYDYVGNVNHIDFQSTAERHRRRTILIATKQPISLDGAVLVKAEVAPKYNYFRSESL